MYRFAKISSRSSTSRSSKLFVEFQQKLKTLLRGTFCEVFPTTGLGFYGSWRGVVASFKSLLSSGVSVCPSRGVHAKILAPANPALLRSQSGSERRGVNLPAVRCRILMTST